MRKNPKNGEGRRKINTHTHTVSQTTVKRLLVTTHVAEILMLLRFFQRQRINPPFSIFPSQCISPFSTIKSSLFFILTKKSFFPLRSQENSWIVSSTPQGNEYPLLSRLPLTSTCETSSRHSKCPDLIILIIIRESYCSIGILIDTQLSHSCDRNFMRRNTEFLMVQELRGDATKWNKHKYGIFNTEEREGRTVVSKRLMKLTYAVGKPLTSGKKGGRQPTFQKCSHCGDAGHKDTTKKPCPKKLMEGDMMGGSEEFEVPYWSNAAHKTTARHFIHRHQKLCRCMTKK